MHNKKLFIIHFNPIEVYPPAMNTLRYLEEKLTDTSIQVLTTKQHYELKDYIGHLQGTSIRRFSGINRKQNALIRLWNYLVFYGSSLYVLLLKRPDTILYYETLSSLPALLYKFIFNRQARILVHYHEYTNATEYKDGMFLVKLFHWLEVKMYPSFSWVSHTNQMRLEKFKSDHSDVAFGKMAIVPNYPPKSWLSKANKFRTGEVLRVIYVGSLSLETMYFREFCSWVEEQRGEVTLDVYAYNVSGEVKGYLSSIRSSCIYMHPGVDYEQLPGILSAYHVGVVLYKGISDNHVYSAPNKVFEYLARGLDVWFPQELVGTHEYVTGGVYPKVVSLNFNQLYNFDWKNTLNREGHSASMHEFYCEKVLNGLVEVIKTY